PGDRRHGGVAGAVSLSADRSFTGNHARTLVSTRRGTGQPGGGNEDRGAGRRALRRERLFAIGRCAGVGLAVPGSGAGGDPAAGSGHPGCRRLFARARFPGRRKDRARRSGALSIRRVQPSDFSSVYVAGLRKPDGSKCEELLQAKRGTGDAAYFFRARKRVAVRSDPATGEAFRLCVRIGPGTHILADPFHFYSVPGLAVARGAVGGGGTAEVRAGANLGLAGAAGCGGAGSGVERGRAGDVASGG